MKQLILMRHAKADNPSKYAHDYDRDLKPIGRRNAADIGQSLFRDGSVRLDLLVSSGAVRALATAEIVARQMSVNTDTIVTDDRLYNAFPDQFVQVLNSLPESCNGVALFAHNPGVEMMASWLLNGFEWFMPTAAVVGVELAIDHWGDLSQGVGSFHFYKVVEKRVSVHQIDRGTGTSTDITNGVVTVRDANMLTE